MRAPRATSPESAVAIAECQSQPARPITATTALRLIREAMPNHNETVGPRFSTPYLPRPAQHLPHVGLRAVTRETFERLSCRIKADNGIGAEIRQPNLILLVYIDRIRFWGRAWKLPALPTVVRRIEDADLPGVPLANP